MNKSELVKRIMEEGYDFITACEIYCNFLPDIIAFKNSNATEMICYLKSGNKLKEIKLRKGVRTMGKGKKKAVKASTITYGVCHCGCGQVPTGKKALFITGHDGKLRSLLVRFQEGKESLIPEIAKEILPTFYRGKYRNVA